MKTLLLIGLVVLLVVVGAQAAWGQTDPVGVWPTGCDEGVQDAIQETAPDVAYRAACDAYLACVQSNQLWGVCQFKAANPMLMTCAEDDTQCTLEALLYTAALAIYSPSFYLSESYESVPDRGLRSWSENAEERFLDVLRQVALGDFVKASELMGTLWVEEVPQHEMFFYVVGLLYEMQGWHERALNAYSESIAFSQYRYSPAMFSRGVLFGKLGRTVEASLDATRLAEFLNQYAPELLSLILPLTDRYPIEETAFVPWLAYPITRINPVSGFAVDLSLREPAPVEFAFWPEQGAVAMRGFPGTPPGYDLLAMTREEWVPARPLPSGSLGTFSSGFESTKKLNFSMHSGYTLAGWVYTGGESYSFDSYILTPVGSPDPRIELGPRWCERGVISRLRPGMAVGDGSHYPPRESFVTPGDRSAKYDYGFSSAPVVTGDPVCVGTTTWWYVQDEAGHVGWIPENVDNQYLAMPAAGSGELFYCPSATPTRLFDGAQARVTGAPGEVNVYATWYRGASVIGTLERGDVIELVRGPFCSQDAVWWGLTMDDGQTGYMPESDANSYFLEPVPDSP